MSQPKWKFVGNIGDASPLEYGGFFVFVDETGTYEAEAEVYDPDEHTAHRFTLEQYQKFPSGIVAKSWVENPYRIKSGEDPEIRANHAWWYDKLDELCETNGITRKWFINSICSEDTIQLALAYRELILYFGPDEFDQYPLRLTETEAEERYEEMGVL